MNFIPYPSCIFLLGFSVPPYHKEIEKARLMEVALDLFSIVLPVHLHDTVVPRYILLFLELVNLVAMHNLCLHTLSLAR